MTRRAALVLVALGWASVAGAQLRFPQTRTTLLRLDGVWGGPSGEHVAAADLPIAWDGLQERMQVERVEVLMGDRSGPDVLSEASARRPAFRLHGLRELRDRLTAARPGDRVQITGYHRSGSADLDVTGVVVTPAGAAPLG